MQVYHDLERLPASFRNPALTIGNFDGVHLGHRLLFDRVKEIAAAMSGQSVVLTFEPHPVKVLSPQNGPPLITPYVQKEQLIEAAGIDVLIVIHFTPEFAAMSAEEFVRRIVHDKIGARAVVVGPDYRFGRKRQGDIPLLRRLGNELGFEVYVVSDLSVDGREVSSSAIRTCVKAGDLEQARRMLGRHYRVMGEVIRGRDRGGRLLGFPTANLRLVDELTPKSGVYATLVVVDGETYMGATNVGYNPTFKDESLSVETHILDFDREIYGKVIEVHFVERLRDEQAFSGPEELAAQIRRDVEEARRVLSQTCQQRKAE